MSPLICMPGFVPNAAFQAHGLSNAKVMWIDVGTTLILTFGLLFHFNSGHSI